MVEAARLRPPKRGFLGAATYPYPPYGVGATTADRDLARGTCIV